MKRKNTNYAHIYQFAGHMNYMGVKIKEFTSNGQPNGVTPTIFGIEFTDGTKITYPNTTDELVPSVVWQLQDFKI